MHYMSINHRNEKKKWFNYSEHCLEIECRKYSIEEKEKTLTPSSVELWHRNVAKKRSKNNFSPAFHAAQHFFFDSTDYSAKRSFPASASNIKNNLMLSFAFDDTTN